MHLFSMRKPLPTLVLVTLTLISVGCGDNTDTAGAENTPTDDVVVNDAQGSTDTTNDSQSSLDTSPSTDLAEPDSKQPPAPDVVGDTDLTDTTEDAETEPSDNGALADVNSTEDTASPVDDDTAAPVDDDTAAPVDDDAAAPVDDDAAAPMEDVWEQEIGETPDIDEEPDTSDSPDTETPSDTSEKSDTTTENTFPQSPADKPFAQSVDGELKTLLEPSDKQGDVTHLLVMDDDVIAQSILNGSYSLSHYKNGKWYPVDTGMEKIRTSLILGQNPLFATDNGVFIMDKGFVFLSPLTDVVADSGITSMVNGQTGGSPSFWFSDANGIHHWKAGLISQWIPGDFPAQDALLEYGADYNGEPALWVYGEGLLYAIVLDEQSQWTAHSVLDDINVTQMATDGLGQLWVIHNDDTVFMRHTDGLWDWFKLPEPTTTLSAHGSAEDLWLTTTQSLVHQQFGVFRPIKGAPKPSLIHATQPGQAVMASGSGIYRVFTEAPEKPKEITWTTHIEPVFLNKCAMCHGENSIATQLTEKDMWMANIDAIINAVKTTMPANDPPLDADSVDLIEAWADDGFPL